MSIEKKIEDLIDALERNTEALKNSITLTIPAEEFLPGEPDSKPSRTTVDPVNVEIKRIEERSQEKPVLKYEDMVTAFRQYIGKHGRDKAAEVLTSFGITGKLTQDQLPEGKYQAFLDKLK